MHLSTMPWSHTASWREPMTPQILYWTPDGWVVSFTLRPLYSRHGLSSMIIEAQTSLVVVAKKKPLFLPKTKLQPYNPYPVSNSRNCSHTTRTLSLTAETAAIQPVPSLTQQKLQSCNKYPVPNSRNCSHTTRTLSLTAETAATQPVPCP